MTHAMDFAVMENTSLFRGVDTALIRELFENRSLGTPMLLLSRAEIRRNYLALKAALPRVGIHYAVKSNNHQQIIDEVAAGGGNFDVCSAKEIESVLKTGVASHTLIHSHPVKTRDEFDYAVGKGVEIFVVDNPSEIPKFNRYTDKKLKVLIRYRINTNTRAVVNLQYKFGCTVAEVLPLARQIQEAGHEFYGLCFHIGSQCIYPENYVKAINAAKDLIHALDLEGFDTRVLDIGGGFPVEYIQPIPNIEDFCVPIRKALDKKIRPGIKVVCEPGRFISASPVTLVCSVIGKSFRDGKMWYYLDDGLYSTFSGIVYDHCQYPVVTNKRGNEKLSVLAGPTCDSFDVMYDGLFIPEHEIGEMFVFPMTGAYCAVSGSDFNSLYRPEYKVIEQAQS
ncbi:MAG: type III PLP-dependent enzyme [Candidatus Zixiibacteriota bacterium]